MHVPTYIVILVAPINILLNWLLGLCLVDRENLFTANFVLRKLVWGPEPFRLGYKGAPISTAISFNLISVLTLAYGMLYSPPEAWHPPSSKSFKSLGFLMQLGLAGVGERLYTHFPSFNLVNRATRPIGYGMVELGTY
jgi:MATE family multidrug resistance protein